MSTESESEGSARERNAFVMAPIDWLNPQAGPQVPLLVQEAQELGEVRKKVEAFAASSQGATPLAVLVPSWRRHPLAFGVLRACLTLAGVRTIVATVDDTIWAALYAHSSDQTYGIKNATGKSVSKSSRKQVSTSDTLRARKQRRQRFMEALDMAHSSIAAQAHLLAQASLGSESVSSTVRIILIADSDAGWLCRSLLRARGKRIASTNTALPRPVLESRTGESVKKQIGEDIVLDSTTMPAPANDAGGSLLASITEGASTFFSSVVETAKKIPKRWKRTIESEAFTTDDNICALSGVSSSDAEQEGRDALDRLTVESLMAEARTRVAAMLEDEEQQWALPDTDSSTKSLHDALEVSALVSVGRFTMGSNAAQTAYLTAATLGQKRIGRKAENVVEKSYDASLGAFRGAAVPAPDGVYVLELQGSRGDATDQDAEADRVLMSCMSAELTTPEDLCFLNYEGADIDTHGEADVGIRKVTLAQGGDALAEPLAVARWIRRVMENIP